MSIYMNNTHSPRTVYLDTVMGSTVKPLTGKTGTFSVAGSDDNTRIGLVQYTDL